MEPHAGRKVLTLQTIPAREGEEHGTDQFGRIEEFLLHVGVLVNAREHKKLERICRYIFRFALSQGTPGADRSWDGQIRSRRVRIGTGLLGGNPTFCVWAGRPSAIGLYGKNDSIGVDTAQRRGG